LCDFSANDYSLTSLRSSRSLPYSNDFSILISLNFILSYYLLMKFLTTLDLLMLLPIEFLSKLLISMFKMLFVPPLERSKSFELALPYLAFVCLNWRFSFLFSAGLMWIELSPTYLCYYLYYYRLVLWGALPSAVDITMLLRANFLG